MSVLPQGKRRLHEIWERAVLGIARHHAALSDRLRLGIVPRLMISFIGFGGLVLTTNFVVEHGVLVERTTEITRTVSGWSPSPIPPAGSAQHVEPKAAPPERRVITSDALSLALDRYEGAVRERLTARTEQTDATLQGSARDLDRAATAFFTAAASISGKPQVRAATALKDHERQGDVLVRAGDDRRELSSKYAALLDALKTRDKRSLDGAWRIFGRVVTRQSLLQLGADIDLLLRDSSALDAAANREPIGMEALVKAEAAVQKDLEDNHNALARSEGTAWYTAMRADLTELASVRESIVQANESISRGIQEFSQGAAELTRLIPSKVESSVESRRASAGAPEPGAGIAPEQAGPVLISTAPTALPVVETHTVTKNIPPTDSKRVHAAWLSAAVLALLAYIAIGTAVSIIRPVRRLLRATARLAKGDTSVRMRRGGLKELDTVAVAFNRMAEEISAARATTRDYQQSLELKVVERTRQLQDLAQHDPLTGLPNRRELFVLLNAAIERAQAANERMAVFFLDVDNFKYINDSMGHAFGDCVLLSLAHRLRETTRHFGFSARLGGDEFTVVFEHAADAEAIRAAGMHIVQAFQKPLTVEGRDLVVSVSVGASIYPEHDGHAESLLQAADAALFRAKAMGRSQLSIFTPDLLDEAAEKFTMEQNLRRALERGEFELVFQPEIATDTLETALVEALIRWRTPDGRLIPPSEFLPIAEESGLILEISDWVLRSAIEAAAQWHHGAWPDVCVAINVSPRQFMDANFVDRLCGLLREHRLPIHCIEIELTESVLQTGPSTIDALRRLRAHGAAIALDDFGTGYSCLASLVQLPLTRIKLDRSLIAQIGDNPRSAAIAKAIIAMCQGLGLGVTAEGVENQEQFSRLVGHHGVCLQGFLLAHPTSREELIPSLEKVAQRSRHLLLESPARSVPEKHSAVRLAVVSESARR